MKVTYNNIIRKNIDFDDRLNDKQIRNYDTIVVIALIMIIATHMITNIIVMKTVNITGAEYSDIVKTHEANPIAKWLLLIGNIRMLFSIIIIPALVGSLYYLIRLGRNKYYIAQTSTLFIMIAILNITNDLSVLLGLLMK